MIGDVYSVCLRLVPDGDLGSDSIVDCSYYEPNLKSDEEHECICCRDDRSQYALDAKRDRSGNLPEVTHQDVIHCSGDSWVCLDHVSVLAEEQGKSKFEIVFGADEDGMIALAERLKAMAAQMWAVAGTANEYWVKDVVLSANEELQRIEGLCRR